MLLLKLIQLLQVEATQHYKTRQHYKHNKLKMISPKSSDEFELPDGSYSTSKIQDYIEYITKKHQKICTNPAIHI